MYSRSYSNAEKKRNLIIYIYIYEKKYKCEFVNGTEPLEMVLGNVWIGSREMFFLSKRRTVFYCRRDVELRGPLTAGRIDRRFFSKRSGVHSSTKSQPTRRRRQRLAHTRKIYGDGARVHPYLPADYALFELDFDCPTRGCAPP